jgi:hypothetical protein
MDRDRFGGFGHDLALLFEISPAFPRHLSISISFDFPL